MIDWWTVRGERFGVEDWDFRVELMPDPDAHPNEYDCYSPADKEAFQRGDWTFVDVTVVPQDAEGNDVKDAAAYLSGVEHGTIGEVTIGREKFLEHPLPDMVEEVIQNLMDQGHAVTRTNSAA